MHDCEKLYRPYVSLIFSTVSQSSSNGDVQNMHDIIHLWQSLPLTHTSA